MERSITLGGTPFGLLGDEVKLGAVAPDFVVQTKEMKDCTRNDFAGKTLILCAIPSVYTGVCDVEIRRFNEEATKLEDTVILAVSMDLPMAQQSWCGAAGVENVVLASDHRTGSFGMAFGCLIESGPFERMFSRAVFVVGPDGKLAHVEYVGEVGDLPDYGAALAATRALTS